MRRRNPPTDIDSPDVLGGECVVWALAAATGKTVPEVRRACLDAGVDIWTDDGKAKGMMQAQLRLVMRKMDIERRIFSIGYAGMFSGDDRAMSMVGRAAWKRFDETPGESQLPKDFSFDAREKRTVANAVRMADKHGFAMIGMTSSIQRRRVLIRGAAGTRVDEYTSIDGSLQTRTTRLAGIKFVGRTHMVGWSPKMGFYDTAVENPETRKAYDADAWDPKRDFGAPIRKRTGLEWRSHGNNIPEPRRHLAFWCFFRGE